MSENIFSTSDDDIFEDYVDDSTSSVDDNNVTDPQTLDKIFSEVDSPFKKLLQNSSLKVNLGEAFYAAADEWVNAGYKEAHASAIVKQLAELTDGRFLYNHRLECSKEVIARKKTIIKFINMLLDTDAEKNLIASAGSAINLNLSESYFDIFFRSYYNIEMFMLQHEMALYKSLCDIMQIPHDESLLDLNNETEVIQNTAEIINDLYIQYFDKDNLEGKMSEYVKEFRTKKED